MAALGASVAISEPAVAGPAATEVSTVFDISARIRAWISGFMRDKILTTLVSVISEMMATACSGFMFE